MVILLLGSIFCLAFMGCSKIYGPVEEVKAFINEKDDVILQISKKIEANPSEAGVDEAQKILESKKDSLKAKRQGIRDKSQSINSDWMTMLAQSDVNDNKYFEAIRVKLAADCKAACSPAQAKLSKIEDDFKAAVR
ncbi:MAG TPA: hypothetical protein VF721_01770 [Pyrinomonadaceae bacterium]